MVTVVSRNIWLSLELDRGGGVGGVARWGGGELPLPLGRLSSHET